jgi:hypothetical protein
VDYNKLADKTLSIIAKYGSTVTLSSFSAGTYNPTEGNYSATTYNDVSVNAVFDTVEGYSGRQTRPTDIITTILSEKVDCICYIPSSGLTSPPTIADRIIKMGERFEIVGRQQLRPAEISLLFTLFLRKG